MRLLQRMEVVAAVWNGVGLVPNEPTLADPGKTPPAKLLRARG